MRVLRHRVPPRGCGLALLKRSIIGSYHKISRKHLPAYIDEMEWRYHNRKNPYLFRDTLLELIGSERLEYKTLTA